MKNKLFLLAIAFPILALFLLTMQKALVKTTGEKFELNITGYDPVDLLSGHFVTYRVDYGVDSCSEEEVCVCLENVDGKTLSTVWACSEKSCVYYLKGKCKYGRIETGIEKYFIPENKASKIDKIVRQGKSRVRFSLDKKGNAVVEDLILVEE